MRQGYAIEFANGSRPEIPTKRLTVPESGAWSRPDRPAKRPGRRAHGLTQTQHTDTNCSSTPAEQAADDSHDRLTVATVQLSSLE